MGLMSCIDTFMWHMKFLFLTKHKDVRSSNRSILRRSSYMQSTQRPLPCAVTQRVQCPRPQSPLLRRRGPYRRRRQLIAVEKQTALQSRGEPGGAAQSRSRVRQTHPEARSPAATVRRRRHRLIHSPSLPSPPSIVGGVSLCMHSSL